MGADGSGASEAEVADAEAVADDAGLFGGSGGGGM